MSKVKTTIVNQSEVFGGDFEDPTKFFIQNAMGDFIFFHTLDREKAQAAADEMYGKGKYKVRTSRIEKAKGDLTCTGSNTRRGFAPRLKNLK